MDPILAGLNAAQCTAVTSPSTVLQILAPPGSGKTKTLTSRVAFLLSYHGYKPWNILCLTFTVKSSREMRGRIAKLIGNGTEAKLVLGTFHSVCWRYLISYGHLIGIRRGFGVADSSDSSSIIKRIVKRQRLSIDPRKAQSRISSLKSKGVRLFEIRQQTSELKNVDQQEFFVVFEAYEDQLNRSNLLDYDDLLLRCADLLRQHPACVSNVEVVLIDEFQDTNVVQFDLMTLFAARHQRITTVGDPDQSIYGWRSAETRNLGRMQTQYPDTLVIHLENNYRSSGAILLAAAEVIEQDESRRSRRVMPTLCPGTMPVLRKLPNAEIEAKWIISEIKRAIEMTGNLLNHADFAVLLRSASLSRHIEAAMGKAGIPYRVVGGQKFFDRLEIKILLDYLRVFSQPDNNDALSRIINVPARNIGIITVKALLEEAEVRKLTLWTLVQNSVQGRIQPRFKISKQAERSMSHLTNLILSARHRLFDASNPCSPEDILKFVIKKLEFREHLKKNYESDHEGRWANVEELLTQASEYAASGESQNANEDVEDHLLPQLDGLNQEKGNPSEEALSRFLANVALATESQRTETTTGGELLPETRVTISTIHAAKGLEWPVVYIPSAYEGSIPHSRAEDTDEERRLLYVAMTRAQALLYISCPSRNSQKEETTLSPFLRSKKVNNYFVAQGPKFDWSIVADISQILRRRCPLKQVLMECCAALPNQLDDIWPLNGEEIPQPNEDKWSHPIEITSGVHKRLKLSNKDIDEKLQSGIDAEYVSYSKPNTFVGISTTMQNVSSFSYQGCRGFSSAASQLHALPKEVQDIGSAAAPCGRQHLARVEPRNPTGNLCQQKLIPGRVLEIQGTLPNLWASKSRNATSGATTNVKQTSCKPAKRDGFPNEKTLTGFGDTVQLSTADPISQRERTEGFQSKIAPVTVPHGPANQKQRLMAGPNVRFAETGIKPTDNQYVLLSSSPPPVHALGVKEGKLANGFATLSDTQTSLENNGSEDEQVNHNMQPAATIHSTSSAEVKGASHTSKKTLGIRRTMAGWSSRGRQNFSIPSKARKTP